MSWKPLAEAVSRGVSLSVSDVHTAAGFTKGLGHHVVTVPGGTVQGVFFFLATDMRALTSKEVQGRVKHYGKVMSRSWMERHHS
jgi:hypothetical protein